MAAMAEKMSNGRLKITIDSKNKHKASFGVYDMVRPGQYDMGHSASKGLLTLIRSALLHPTALSFVYVAQLHRAHSTLLDEKIVPAELIGLVLTGPDGENRRISASTGLSSHNGHPDYSHILTREDKALFQAKSAGRNQIVIAEI